MQLSTISLPAEFSSCEATVISLRYDKEFVDEIKDGQLAGVLLDHTCFYAEQGGQVYDTGFITKTRDEVCLWVGFSYVE